MKKNMLYGVMVVTLAICLLAPGCGKSDKGADIKVPDNAGGDLIKALNNTPLGIVLNVAPENIKLKPEGKRFLVTFVNPDFSLDLSKYNDFLKGSGMSFKDEKLPVKMKEWVFRYGPEEKYLSMVSCSGLSADIDFLKYLNFPKGQKEIGPNDSMRLKFALGHLLFKKEIDVGVLLEPGKPFDQLMLALMEKSTTNESELENLKYEVTADVKGKAFAFIVEADKITGRQQSSKLYLSQILKAEYKVEEFDNLLKSGEPLLDLYAKASGLKMTVIEKDKVMGSGKLDSATFSYFVKPNEEKTAFRFGFNFDMNGMVLSSDKLPMLALFGDLKEFKMDFMLSPISAKVLAGYMKFNRNQKGLQSAKPEERAKIMGEFFGTLQEFMAGKPSMDFSIAPLKHALGEIGLTGKLHVVGMGAPEGKAELTIKDFNGMLERLKSGKLIPAEKADGIIALLKGFLTPDENGDVKASIEIKDNGKSLYINGKKLAL